MMTEQDREYVGSVALVVLGDALDPDEVSSNLQLTPSQCWRKGEKWLRLADGTIRVRESEYEWGGWKLLVAGERKDSPIESQLEYWVDLLRSRTAALKRLRVLGHECALDVFVTSSGTASIVVPHQLQKEVAALAVDIRLSFFADSEPERTGEPMPADKDNELDEISRSLHEARNLIRAIGNEPPEPYRPQEPEFPYCSFCGKGKGEVGTLVEGPAVFICDECVEKAQEIIRDRKSAPKPGI